MNDNAPLILAAILLIVGAAILIMYLFLPKQKSKKKTTQYFVQFIIGVIFGIMGIFIGAIWSIVIGLWWAASGFMHRREWKNEKEAWNKLDKSQKIFWIIVDTVFVVLVIFLLAVYIGAKYFGFRASS